MSKTITLTNKEIETLRIFMNLNPCESHCILPNPPEEDDCYATKTNGEYKCPIMQTALNIRKKIGDDN